MIVPKYWAESKVKSKVNDRNITLKRFGWSDISQDEAEKNAKERVDEAFKRALSGEKVRRVDHKVSYNGAEGLPIREEVIEHYNDSVITRNAYGALCLNTPDVLFADIDIQTEASTKLNIITFITLFIALLYMFVQVAGLATGLSAIISIILPMIMTSSISNFLLNAFNALKGGVQKIAMEKVKLFSSKNPDWHLRVYKTPAGYRVLVMHDTFEPRSAEALEFLNQLDSDPLYIQMCKNQNCFRARLSPKPWRIGLSRIAPNSGVWPIKEEKMSARSDWVYRYEKVSLGYASCKFVEKLGSDIVNDKAGDIRRIHDKYCRSDSDLTLA